MTQIIDINLCIEDISCIMNKDLSERNYNFNFALVVI